MKIKKLKFAASRITARILRGLDVIGGIAITTKIGAIVLGRLIPRSRPLLCSSCFRDAGLKENSKRWGIRHALACPNCGDNSSLKLTRYLLEGLTHEFFVRGSVLRMRFGAAPLLQFNDRRETDADITRSENLSQDIALLSKTLKIGIFHYGPRMWMIGEVEPLKELIDETTRAKAIERIFQEYPIIEFPESGLVYRLRKNPRRPADFSEYDSPPKSFHGGGRMDSPDLSIMYCSQDIEQCVHECRVTVEDELYLATLKPTRALKLLDLSYILSEPSVTEFESMDIAIHMLFVASEHSYPISRAIAHAAHKTGIDGIIYPSYFSNVRSAAVPFETVYGLSVRRFASVQSRLKKEIFQNLAIFGHPIATGILKVECVNRLIVQQLKYEISYGPVIAGHDSDSA